MSEPRKSFRQRDNEIEFKNQPVRNVIMKTKSIVL